MTCSASQAKRLYGKRGDPFYEAQENHNLIGVTNVFLECLFCDVKLQYAVPIISQQGEVRPHQPLENDRCEILLTSALRKIKILCVNVCVSVCVCRIWYLPGIILLW